MQPVVIRAIEEELAQAPPRAVRITRQGLAETLTLIGAVALSMAGGGWRFAVGPAAGRTAAADVFLIAFLAVGACLILRFLSIAKTRRDLVRSGVAAEGVVIAKTRQPLGSARYAIWYSADGREWKIEVPAGRSRAGIGDVVTVLHDASRPGRALAYPFAGWRARPEGPGSAPGISQSAFQPRI